jgi:hypothetical protein
MKAPMSLKAKTSPDRLRLKALGAFEYLTHLQADLSVSFSVLPFGFSDSISIRIVANRRNCNFLPFGLL